MTNHYPMRRFVLKAARQGRAEYLPEGARGNATARVLIDGKDAGPAAVLLDFVRVEPGTNKISPVT